MAIAQNRPSGPGCLVVVEDGDEGFKLARASETTDAELIRWNVQVSDWSNLQPGDTVYVASCDGLENHETQELPN